MTPFIVPTKWSLVPKSVIRVMMGLRGKIFSCSLHRPECEQAKVTESQVGCQERTGTTLSVHPSHCTLDAGKTGEVALRVQFQRPQPGVDGIVDLPKLEKAETERLMNEGVANAETQSFFISHLRTDPVLKVNTLKSALARSH